MQSPTDEAWAAYVETSAAALGLPLCELNRAEVLANFQRIASIAAALDARPLPPGVEPLTVFRP